MSAAAAKLPLARQVAVFAGDIKINHTLFALPWALLSMTMAAHAPGVGLTPLKVGLILVCMVTARTCAMSANRLLDANLDAINPRTARRAIPAGKLSRDFYLVALLACAAIFISACAAFRLRYANILPLIFSPIVLAFVCAYPLLKRFTRLCHYYLGAALGLAPICAWVAIRGDLELPPVLMSIAVLLWTAGFDIIYACQDFQSDRATGVHSIPAKLGVSRGLWVSRLTHLACVAALVMLALSSPQLGTLFWIAVALAVALLIVEQSLVRADDLSKVSLAFFTVNGVISLLIGALGIADVLRR